MMIASKIKKIGFLSISILVLLPMIHCGSSSNSSAPHGLHLNIDSSDEFNPNADHGRIEKYRVTITGTDLPNQIVRYYPFGTSSAVIDGLDAGSDVIIDLAAINVNDVTVRHGESEPINIKANTNSTANLSVNNVPIFANVRHGAVVYNNRFNPKIFAPGEIDFQLTSTVGSSSNLLEDTVLGTNSFSINSSEISSVMAIHSPQFEIGVQKIRVEAPDTGEASEIEIKVLDGAGKKGLTVSSGAHLGTLFFQKNNLITTQSVMTAF